MTAQTLQNPELALSTFAGKTLKRNRPKAMTQKPVKITVQKTATRPALKKGHK